MVQKVVFIHEVFRVAFDNSGIIYIYILDLFSSFQSMLIHATTRPYNSLDLATSDILKFAQ